MNVQRSKGWLTALAMAGVALMAAATTTPAARAAVSTFSTAAGAKESGGNAVSATATFTTSAGQLVITLANLLANPKTVAQAISDLVFKVSSGTSLSSSSLLSSSGKEIAIASNGTGTLGSTVATGWGYNATSTKGTLDVLGTKTAPTHLIIGPGAGGGNSTTYSAANASIAGNKPHNPFLYKSATFTIKGSSITANTTITAATFSFGTSPNNNVPGGNVVPEPSSLAIAGLGALGFIGYGLRRRRKK